MVCRIARRCFNLGISRELMLLAQCMIFQYDVHVFLGWHAIYRKVRRFLTSKFTMAKIGTMSRRRFAENTEAGN